MKSRICCYLSIILLLLCLILYRDNRILRTKDESLSVEAEVFKGETSDLKMKELFKDYLIHEKHESYKFKSRSEINRFIPDVIPLRKDYAISQKFSSQHNGIDFAASVGERVYSAAAGHIITSDYDEYYGKLIVIDHLNGYRTYYGHLQDLYVIRGNFTEKGEIIGTTGSTGYSTGPHLHYSISYQDSIIDPELLWQKE